MSTTALGWISDDRGVPCVSGKRITDAASFLTQRILVGAAEDKEIKIDYESA